MTDRHKATPLALRLPEDERAAVVEAAAREAIAVNEWLKRAIRERLARNHPEAIA
jgi:predicted HicB family RNase H-like nuclease